LSSRKSPKTQRRVYVIEIMPQWYDLVAPGLPSGKKCFYVGETGKDLGERFREHRTGKSLAGKKQKRTRVFTRMRKSKGEQDLKNKVDLKLRRRMSEQHRPVRSAKARVLKAKADALEKLVIDELRLQGHAVYPKGPGTGSLPFGSYLDAQPNKTG